MGGIVCINNIYFVTEHPDQNCRKEMESAVLNVNGEPLKMETGNQKCENTEATILAAEDFSASFGTKSRYC